MSAGPRSFQQRCRAWARSRLKTPLFRHQWKIITALWCVCFILGVWGYWIYDRSHDLVFWLPQTAYRALQLFTFKGGEEFGQVSWQLEAARWLSPMIAAYTAAKGLVGVFYQQAQVARAAIARKHVIVCGLSDKGRLIATSFLRNGDIVVIIEKDADRGKTAAVRAEGAIVLAGEAHEPGVLRSAGLRRASFLIAVCDDETNTEILHQVRLMAHQGRHTPDCLVHLKTPDLQERLWDYQENTSSSGSLNVRFFNLEQSGARAMTSRYSPFPLDVATPCPPPRVVIAGEGLFLRHFLESIAERWLVRTVFTREHMTVIPYNQAVTDTIALVRESAPILWENVQVMEMGSDATLPESADTVFVLEETSASATSTALDLLPRLSPDAHMVIKHQRHAGLARLLQDGAAGCSVRISVFSAYEDTCAEPDLLLGARNEALARLVHERYLGEHPGVLPDWNALPEMYRSVNRNQADWIERIMEDAGFELYMTDRPVDCCPVLAPDMVERLSATEHRRWCVQHMREGWTFGLERDGNLRTHPDLVPWENLTGGEQDKDRMFVRDWPRMLAHGTVRFVLRAPE